MTVWILLVSLNGAALGVNCSSSKGTFQIEFKTKQECQKGSVVINNRFCHTHSLCLEIRK
jgi:hypothetical protein